jgi:hypothetical protein
MKTGRVIFLFALLTASLYGQEENPETEVDALEGGFLAIEGGLGYNTYETSQYYRTPLFFTGGSAQREIATRLLLLSDIGHASDYFSGNNSFLKSKGLYLFNYGLLDVDYLSWRGRIWSLGMGAGLAHQGFLISGADKSAHAIVLRLRAQGFLYWFDYLATQVVITLPVAVYQSATDEFRMVHGELNMLFDFKGRVRNPEPQSFFLSVSLHYDYTHITHEIRNYSQHELTPMFKAMVLY